MIPHDANERSASAGEFVLGTLSDHERTEFERAAADDQDLQAEVYAWQDRLLHLTARVTPQTPDAGLWPRIEILLTPSRVLVTEIPVEAPARAVTPPANDALWQRLRRWQMVAGGALAAAVLLASILVMKTLVPPPETATRYLAVLQAPNDGATGWVVEVKSGNRVHLVPTGASPTVPAGKAVQFWTKAEDAAVPTSLGLIQPGRRSEFVMTTLPAVGERQLFELTLEPAGGSTIGKPTGPILFLGRTVRF